MHHKVVFTVEAREFGQLYRNKPDILTRAVDVVGIICSDSFCKLVFSCLMIVANDILPSLSEDYPVSDR